MSEFKGAEPGFDNPNESFAQLGVAPPEEPAGAQPAAKPADSISPQQAVVSAAHGGAAGALSSEMGPPNQ